MSRLMLEYQLDQPLKDRAGAGFPVMGICAGMILLAKRVSDASLQGLGIPGYRVQRWEKEADRFRDPASWPEISVATTGTHDTESSMEWWDALPDWERAQARRIPGLERLPDERLSSV